MVMATSQAVTALDEDISRLVPLDERRTQFETWRREGREALKYYAERGGQVTEKTEAWSPPHDIGDCALVVKVLCRPGETAAFESMLSKLRTYPKEAIFGDPPFEKAKPKAAKKSRRGTTVIENKKSERRLSVFANPNGMPLADAAFALAALAGAPSQAFTHETTMLLYYVAVRELYQPSAPLWVVGGARAGVDGRPSAFITSEFVRAILSFARMLERTGAYAGALAEMQRSVLTTIPAWNEEDAKRRTLSLYITLAQRAWNLAIPLAHDDAAIKRPTDKAITGFEQTIVPSVIAALEKSNNTFEAAYRHVETFRASEEAEAREAGPDHRLTILCERSASAHSLALRALKDAATRANAAHAIFNGLPTDASGSQIAERLDQLQKLFLDAANTVWNLTLPAQEYLSTVLDAELAIASTGETRFEPAEMAAAASALGAARGWEEERIAKAGEMLTRVLTPDGFAVARAFHTTDNGYVMPERTPIIGAFAQILEHVPSIEVSPVLLARIAHVFEKRRWPIDEKRSSWRAFINTPSDLHSAYFTSIATLALDRVCRMLDARINSTVLRHFTVKHLTAPKLHDLFYPDYGLVATGKGGEDSLEARPSIAVSLERMRAHIAGVKLDYDEPLYSVVLHGPPGTGKTTLIEGLAASAGVPLVEVTPSDIVVRGADAVEAQARAVLRALSLLTRTVVLFDEFDPVLRSRETTSETQTIFNFLTPSMLPKLKALYESAKKRRVAYALITNVIQKLDVAAIRSGRFDAAIGVYPPDYLSRAGRLESEIESYLEENRDVRKPPHFEARRDQVLKETAEAPMQHVGKRGWFTRPKRGDKLGSRTAFAYLFSTEANPKMPVVPTGEEWSDAMLSDRERTDLTAIRGLEPPTREFPKKLS